MINNKAEIGGAISHLCQHMQCQLKVLNSIFESNTAEIQGGAIYYESEL